MIGRWMIAGAAALILAVSTLPFSLTSSHAHTSGVTLGGGSAMQAVCDAEAKPANYEFTLTDHIGNDLDFETLKGKVVLLNFWATWCGPCIEVIPDLKRTYNKMHARGFEIIGISLENRKGPKELLAYVKKNGMPWPQYHDGQHWSNKIALSYGVQGIPTMFLIDKKGNLVDFDATIGLEAKVQKLLDK